MKDFVFEDNNQKIAHKIISRYPDTRKPSALLPLLDLAQRQCGGWLPTYAIEYVAEMVGVSYIHAYEVVTFYSMFHTKPVGKCLVQVCGTTPCWLRGADAIMAKCKELESDDVTVIEVECLGACIDAPVVQINDDYYERLTPEKIAEIIEEKKQRA